MQIWSNSKFFHFNAWAWGAALATLRPTEDLFHFHPGLSQRNCGKREGLTERPRGGERWREMLGYLFCAPASLASGPFSCSLARSVVATHSPTNSCRGPCTCEVCNIMALYTLSPIVSKDSRSLLECFVTAPALCLPLPKQTSYKHSP